MIQALGFGLLAGLMLANGIPHFFSGILKRPYPTVFGSGPVLNVVLGWAALGIGVLLLIPADLSTEPVAGGAAIAVGALAMGVFHAAGGAYALARD